MARVIEAGGKIRIEGREFKVRSITDEAFDGGRQTDIFLRCTEFDPVVEDEKPETFDLSSAAVPSAREGMQNPGADVLENVDLNEILDWIETTFKNISELEGSKSFIVGNLLKGFNK
jgi:hypothetical protein